MNSSFVSDMERWAASEELGPMQAAALIIGAAPDRAAIQACRDRLGEDSRARELGEILDQVLSAPARREAA